MRHCFHSAQSRGVHGNIKTPVNNLASELVGLFMEHKQNAQSCASRKEKESHSRNLPHHVHAARQRWACVTKERMCSALCVNPQSKAYWSNRQRDCVFGANLDAFKTKFTGFSVCHPIYDDHIMLKLMQHATYSAAQGQLPTAILLFLLNWANRSANSYMGVFHEHKKYCTTGAR